MRHERKPHRGTIALLEHRELFSALRALYGDLAQVAPPDEAPELDTRTRAELTEIAARLREIEARIRPATKIPPTKKD